jgi:hypothetical protein
LQIKSVITRAWPQNLARQQQPTKSNHSRRPCERDVFPGGVQSIYERQSSPQPECDTCNTESVHQGKHCRYISLNANYLVLLKKSATRTNSSIWQGRRNVKTQTVCITRIWM